MDETFEKLAGILSSVLKIPRETIRPESRLFEDLKADSLDASMVVMEIEEQFGLLVPECQRSYNTVADMLAHVQELLAQTAPAAACSAAAAPLSTTSTAAPVTNGI